MSAIAVRSLYPRLVYSRSAVVRALRTLDRNRPVLKRPRCPAAIVGELSVAFLTDAALAELHADHLGDPSPTDVITFPGDATLGSAGEICVSVDAARRLGEARGADWSRELSLYLVHGWLHLAGHADDEPGARRAMRRAEARALDILERESALPSFGFR